MQLFLATLLVLTLQATANQSSCEERRELKGTILRNNSSGESPYCWKIVNPLRQPIILKGDYLHFRKWICTHINVTVTVNNKNHTLCDSERYQNEIVFGNTDVLVKYNINKRSFVRQQSTDFQLSYEIDISDPTQVKESRLRLINWLKNKRTPSYGWNENTARAIVALYLGEGASFNGTKLDEELMVKETEVRTAIALLEQPIASERLSMLINALLVTCHNPRHFYGRNLVNLLKEQVMSNRNFTHPLAYLTLCNANETWPSNSFEDLSDILNSKHKYPFIKDYQAIAVMALSCYQNNMNSFHEMENGTLHQDYERTVKELKEHQLPDGSFGNIHTTALIMQALISNGLENGTSSYSDALDYLRKAVNSSSLDFSSATLSLPVLNGKSFIDVAKVNCSSSIRRHNEDDIVSDIDDYSGPKMRIEYSLYIGDDRDVIHTISLRVPLNFTAYGVMQLAVKEDPKYKFEMKRIHKDMYIYRIGSLSNDPEDGKFWLQYLKSGNSTEPSYEQTIPDQLLLQDGDHLIMWYRRPSM